MNAYELADELQKHGLNGDNYGLFNKRIQNMLRQQADRINKLEKEAIAKNNYLEQHCEKIDQQADRIAELETALDWIATVNAMDYEYQDVAKSVLKERNGIK